jgi:hypothetical protein
LEKIQKKIHWSGLQPSCHVSRQIAFNVFVFFFFNPPFPQCINVRYYNTVTVCMVLKCRLEFILKLTDLILEIPKCFVRNFQITIILFSWTSSKDSSTNILPRTFLSLVLPHMFPKWFRTAAAILLISNICMRASATMAMFDRSRLNRNFFFLYWYNRTNISHGASTARRRSILISRSLLRSNTAQKGIRTHL